MPKRFTTLTMEAMLHCTDQTAIQVVEHMPLVSINSHTSTLASVAHLGVFDTDPPIFGDPFDKAHLSLFADLYILPWTCLAIARTGSATILSSGSVSLWTQASTVCSTCRTSASASSFCNC